MEIQVYNGEIYDRGKIWYVVFFVVLTVFFVYSFIKGNFVGIILMLLVLGGYIFLNLTQNKIISIQLTEDGIIIDNKLYPYENFEGFSIEIDENNNYKNLILLKNSNPSIFTIHTKDKEFLQSFVSFLSSKIPFVTDFDIGFVNKFLRFLKI